MRVTWADVCTVPGFRPQGGFCADGLRAWCARHGVDLRRLVREGMDEAAALAIGDAFALAVVAHARARAAQDNDKGNARGV